MKSTPVDINGNAVGIGDRVRLLELSGQWLEELPSDEKDDVLSMIGEVFIVEEIDEYGHPWIRKSWNNSKDGNCYGHSLALDAKEMELVNEIPPATD